MMITSRPSSSRQRSIFVSSLASSSCLSSWRDLCLIGLFYWSWSHAAKLHVQHGQTVPRLVQTMSGGRKPQQATEAESLTGIQKEAKPPPPNTSVVQNTMLKIVSCIFKIQDSILYKSILGKRKILFLDTFSQILYYKMSVLQQLHIKPFLKSTQPDWL